MPIKPKTFSGPWTIYRRKEDAYLWERFEQYCAQQGAKPSVMLGMLVDRFLARGPLGPLD